MTSQGRKKDLNIPQRDSCQNWYYHNRESYLITLHNVIELKTTIMRRYFRCKNKKWILS